MDQDLSPTTIRTTTFTRMPAEMRKCMWVSCGSRITRDFLFSVAIALISTTAAGFIVNMINNLSSDTSWSHLEFIIWLGIPVLVYFVFYKIAARDSTDLCFENGLFSGEKNVTLSPDGIEETSQHYKIYSNWNGIFTIRRTNGYMLFYVDKLQACAISERAFPTPADADAFYNEALSLWSAAKQPTNAP